MIRVNQRVGVIATSGAGKSNTAYTMVEQLRRDNYPVCILDVKNEYGGLPKTPILYASQTNASLLVHELKNTNASCIVFMKDQTLKKKRAFIKKFLLECQRESRDIPIMIVIEEARLFAPQGSNPKCKEAVGDLAQGGRSQGYGCLLVSQRCAKIDKDILGNLTDLYIMKHYLPQDIKYLEDFIPRDKVTDLPQFKKGDAYHLNFDEGSLEKVHFEFNPNKKGGGTPEPTQVTPTSMDVKGQRRRKDKDPKMIVIAIVVVSIVILTIIGVILYFVTRRYPEEEELR